MQLAIDFSDLPEDSTIVVTVYTGRRAKPLRMQRTVIDTYGEEVVPDNVIQFPIPRGKNNAQ